MHTRRVHTRAMCMSVCLCVHTRAMCMSVCLCMPYARRESDEMEYRGALRRKNIMDSHPHPARAARVATWALSLWRIFIK
jgi:hypothetical protein